MLFCYCLNWLHSIFLIQKLSLEELSSVITRLLKIYMKHHQNAQTDICLTHHFIVLTLR